MKDRIAYMLVNLAAIVLAAMVLFMAGTWWRLETQYSLGEDAYRRGDFTGAVAGFESAIHMYIPFHPTVTKAAAQLWKIGEEYEQRGDVKRALIAYRALRSSYYADRWLAIPGQEWIARCDQKIAQLVPLLKDQ